MLTPATVTSAVPTCSGHILHFRSSRVSEGTGLVNMFRFAKAAVNLTGKKIGHVGRVVHMYMYVLMAKARLISVS